MCSFTVYLVTEYCNNEEFMFLLVTFVLAEQLEATVATTVNS